MRPLLVLTWFAVAALPAPAPAASDFVPRPRQAFEDFVAINATRADVPVGALWIDGYGPVGEAAAADNIETVRSLHAMTIDKGLQLSFSLGLLDLLGIDPRYRHRLTARFTDLAIVRVKDVSKLAGPKGEPRVVEALRAASVTVSSDGEVGLNGRSLGWTMRNVEGQGMSGRTRAYSIEGRDMFIAIRVATPELTSGPEEELGVRSGPGSDLVTRTDDFEIRIAGGACEPEVQAVCPSPTFSIVKLSTHPTEASATQAPAGEDGTVRLGLPVPVADRKGGLFDAIRLRWLAPCAVRKAEGCARRPRMFARFEGSRLTDVKKPQAKDWL